MISTYSAEIVLPDGFAADGDAHGRIAEIVKRGEGMGPGTITYDVRRTPLGEYIVHMEIEADGRGRAERATIPFRSVDGYRYTVRP